MFYLLGDIVKARVWTYGVPADKNQPRFRTGFTHVLGVIERVPVRMGGNYLVRVAANHCLAAIPEELTPAVDIDPKWALDYLKMYRWPTEYQARQDAIKCVRWDGQPPELPPCPSDAPSPPKNAADAAHPKAAPIPESERQLTKRPAEPRRARRRTTRP